MPQNGFPKISIVTPCLNDARFIDDAIMSVKGQDYPNVEHIVVDGESTDGTLAVLKTYPHLRWISEPDQGLTDAVNKGIRMATGEIIGWLNCDDYYLPGALSSIAGAFARHSETDVLYGEIEFVDIEKNLLRRVRNGDFDPETLMFYRNYVPSNAAFWRRRINDDGHFLDISFKVIMDWEWWLRLSTLGYRFRFLPRNLAAFRIRKDNIGNRLADLLPAEQRRIQELFERHFLKQPIGPLKRQVRFYSSMFKRTVSRVRRILE